MTKPCPSCGIRWIQEASVACSQCRRAAKPKPTTGPLNPEPLSSWECDLCCYRITDERSVVKDAVKEHEKHHRELGGVA